MEALVCKAPFSLALVDRDDPACPEGWVRVQPGFVGVCGTDFHIYEGLHPFLAYPLVIGHEVAGTVSETPVGSRLRSGQRVVVNPYIACGHCGACHAGKPNCCVSIKVLGVHTDGALAGSLVVPEANLYSADDLSARDAAMVEFLAIGAHAVRRGAVAPGARVAVVGAGPIGFGVALFATLRGADVTLIDVNATRLAFASGVLTNVRTLRAGASLVSDAELETGGRLYDLVFDATGNTGSMERGFHLVGAGGGYVFVSVVKDHISFADPLFHAREMTLWASRNATGEDFATVMAAMREGRIPTDRLNTHVAELAEAAEAIPRWLKTPDQVFKAIIRVAG